MLKTVIKRAAYYSGLEIRRIPAVPAWPKPDTEPPRDEILCNERWVYHALQMANRSYQPEKMQYHRTVHGDDTRIKYITYFLDVRDQRVLEIGPLEGHHSIILEKMGVRENIALESRVDNLRKCNRIKDKYRLDRTRFLEHDLERLYRGEEQPQFSGQFDLVFCLGVLYHVPEPGRALEWFRSQSPTLFLGTHYPEDSEGEAEIYSHRARQYRCRYFAEGGISDPIMGMSPKSVWPFEADLLALIRDCGYRTIHVLGRDLQNGTAHITVLAQA